MKLDFYITPQVNYRPAIVYKVSSFNMAPPTVNNPRAATPQRRNLIIEGQKSESDPDVISGVLAISVAIGVTFYAKEIEQVIRLNRRDDTKKRPRPVLVTVSRAVLPDNIFRKKGDLSKVRGMEQMFVNADER